MIKAIIFDCFGVLTADLWREFLDGLPAEADIDRARELNHQYDSGLIPVDEFLEQVEEATGQRPVEVEKLRHNEAAKNTALLGYIAELKPQYKIGLISNIATDWVTSQFLNNQEQALFDDMVFSYQVGTTKPDHKIYQAACDRLGIKPAEAIFIDDVEGYCDAALDFGMQAIHYHGFRQMKTELEAILAHK